MERDTEETLVTAVGVGLAALAAACFLPQTRRRMLQSLDRVELSEMLGAAGVAAAQAALSTGGIEALRRAKDQFMGRA